MVSWCLSVCEQDFAQILSDFYHAISYASAILAVVILSVCPSVRLSATVSLCEKCSIRVTHPFEIASRRAVSLCAIAELLVIKPCRIMDYCCGWSDLKWSNVSHYSFYNSGVRSGKFTENIFSFTRWRLCIAYRPHMHTEVCDHPCGRYVQTYVRSLLCLCLYSSYSNFWKSWPRNFILVCRISRSNSYIKSWVEVKVTGAKSGI